MKAKHVVILLFCSALGLLTAIAYVKRPSTTASAGSSAPPATDVEEPAPKVTVAPQATVKNPVSGKATSEATPPFTWRQVESEDYKQYMANLRGVGCPEQTVREIIIADVNKLYADREAPLKSKPNPAAQTAQTETTPSAQELENRKQLREIQLEKRAVIKELLGIDVPLDLLPSTGSRAYDAFELAFKLLPEEKRDSIQMLQENYWQQSDALRTKYNKKRTPEYLEEYRALTDAHRQELAKILTPAELENYEIRTSTAAKKLGSQLAYFTPSEDEFRQIFRATRDFEESTSRLGGQGVDKKLVAQERAALQTQMTDQLRAALGEERYAEYQRSQDSNYRYLVRIGERYGLPRESVLQAYDLQKTHQQHPPVTEVFTGDGQVVFEGDQKALVAANRAEAARQLDEQLNTVLGDKAAKAYRNVRNGGVRVRDSENVLVP